MSVLFVVYTFGYPPLFVCYFYPVLQFPLESEREQRKKSKSTLRLSLVRLTIALLGRATGEERWIKGSHSSARRSGPKELRVENQGQSILHSTPSQRIQMHGESRE